MHMHPSKILHVYYAESHSCLQSACCSTSDGTDSVGKFLEQYAHTVSRNLILSVDCAPEMSMLLYHSFDNTGSQSTTHSEISLPDTPGTFKYFKCHYLCAQHHL